jgi:peptidoglycan/LPS O-acetylase OafA/YrhL
MPGAFRFFLAATVVLSHLVNTPYYQHLGYYAVGAFFVLSGFAMTTAMNEVYGFDGKRFWTNRFLRLAPQYLAVCFLTAFAIQYDPVDAARFMPRWAFPATTTDVIENVLILPLAFGDLRFRYIEPAWSLAVEIIMYAVLWIGMARSVRAAFVCFANGAAYHGFSLLSGAPFGERYFSLGSALLAFSLGALLYFWRERTKLYTRKEPALFATLAWLANFFAAGVLMPQGYAEEAGFYVNTILAGLVVVSLPALQPGPLARRIDAALGDLSYPIFLVQWFGGFVGFILLSSKAARGWELVLTAAPIILITAIVIAMLNSRFVEPLRRRIRKEEQPRERAANLAAPV